MAEEGTTGLDALKKKYEDQAKRGVVKKSNQLEIKDGDVSVIKFIEDANKIFICGFHGVPTKGKFGEYNQDVYCEAQDGKKCEYCEQIGEDIAIVHRKWHAWVWVDKIYHAKQGDANWMVGKRGKKQYYVEVVNGPRLLRKGEGKSKYLTNKLISIYEEYGSLTDRIFLWNRTGGKRDDTLYDILLSSGDPDFKIEIKGELMSLKEVAQQFKRRETRTGAEQTLKDKIEASSEANGKKTNGDKLNGGKKGKKGKGDAEETEASAVEDEADSPF
jgi:hypothetical protein